MKKLALQVFLTWQEKEKSESNQTPKFLIASTGERRLPSILTGKNLLSFVRTFLEPNRINSVLSGFSLSLFAESHFLQSIKGLSGMVMCEMNI